MKGVTPLFILIHSQYVWGEANPIHTTAIECEGSKVLHTANINSLCNNTNNSSYSRIGSVDIAVVQEDSIGLIQGLKCQKFVSKFSYHCGMYSHLSLDGLYEIRRPVEVPEAQCLEVFMDHKLTTETGEVIMLSHEENVKFHYNFLRLGELIHNTHSVSCQGSTAHLGNKEIFEDLEINEVEFILSTSEFEVTRTQVKDLTTHEILPTHCKALTKCTLPNKELIYFNSRPTQCTLYQIQNIVAEQYEINIEGHIKEVYVNEEHKLIFVKGLNVKHRHAICFRGNPEVFETQIPGILVLRQMYGDDKLDPISADRINPQLQMIMMEDYFNFHLQSKLTSLVHQLNFDFCKINQQTLPLLERSPFNKDAIIRVNGEVVQELLCAETEVFLLPEQKNRVCYSAIPVKIQGKTKYMMAGTRILLDTTEVKEIDCLLVPKYVINGQVIVANPQVQILDLKLSVFKLSEYEAEKDLYSFSKYELGGESNLYTQKEMDEFIQLVHYQRGQKTMKDILTSAYCEEGNCGTFNHQSAYTSGLNFGVLKNIRKEVISLNPLYKLWEIIKELAIYWAVYLFLERVVSLVIKCYACFQFQTTTLNRNEAFRLSFWPSFEMRKLMRESANNPINETEMTIFEGAELSQLEADVQNTKQIDERLARRQKRDKIRDECLTSEK